MSTDPHLAPGRLPVARYAGGGPAAPTPAGATAVRIAMRDGVELAAHVYLPQIASSGPVATVLSRVPYDKAGRYTFWDQMAQRFTAHGFAVVVQDVRGKFESGGALFPFRNEPADGYDTLDWVQAQPWSNGRVGMYGDSYYGFTQWAAASTKHPALKAFVPRVTSSDFFLHADPTSMPRVALREWLVGTFANEFLCYEPVATFVGQPSYQVPEGSEHVMDLIAELTEAVADGSLQRELFPNGWPALDLEIPALHMGGWFDNLLPWQLGEWERVVHSPAAAHQFLRIASTDHEAFPWRELGVPLADHESDDDATATFLDHELAEPLAFFDHYLNERGGRWFAPTVRYSTTNGHTEQSDRWPPSNVELRELPLSDLAGAVDDRGTLTGLTDRPVTCEGSISWVHDPMSPVPFLAESEFALCADLPDESYLHSRPDIVVFDSRPVGAPVDLCGAVSFHGTIDAAAGSTHVVARLLDLYPSGAARLICYGAEAVNTSNGATDFDVPMVATSYRVRSGHSLRLAVSSSCFPAYPVHPGHDGDVWDLTAAAPVTQTLISRADRPLHLQLSVRRPSDRP